MKKILVSLALVLFMSIGVYAQLTPEGVMATLPDMPTAAQMIDFADGKAYELTGSHEYMGGDQLPFSAAFSYLESAGYIDNYNF